MGNWLDGRNIILAAKKATTWRTAVECGASDGLLVTSEGLGAKAPTFVPDDSLGLPNILEYYKVSEAITGGTVTGYLRYLGWDVLLAMALGTAGSPTLDSGTAYHNTYKVADEISGKFCTVAMKKKAASSQDVWEVPSAKITGFTVTAEIGQLATIAFNIVGNRIKNSTEDSIAMVNTHTTMANVTYPSKSLIAKMDANFKVRMKSWNTNSDDSGGSALSDSTDIIYPSMVEISFNRPMNPDFEAGYVDSSEFLQNGFATATLRMRFNKYDMNTYMDAVANDTIKKMDVLFKGSLITGAFYYTMRFDLPRVQFISAESNVGGPGTVPHNIEGQLESCTSAPVGMTGLTSPVNIYVINTRSTDPLG